MSMGRMSWEQPESADSAWRKSCEEFDASVPWYPEYVEWWQIATEQEFPLMSEVQHTCGAMYAMWLDRLIGEVGL